MNHIISKTSGGRSLTIAIGDTITVTLSYDDRQTRLTAWTFADDFSFNACISLDLVDCKDGIRTMIFKAHTAGTIQVALHEFFVLGFDQSFAANRFRLEVTVA
ncbi:MAG: hypothetical protein KGS72_20230 [Cyanobacteria bacterium REEB67]|nr:hypothetical protein [Cyanobacteria bacterium REEB67]